MPHHLMGLKSINLQRAEFKGTENQNEKIMKHASPFCRNFIAATQKWYSTVCLAPMCFYACLMDGVLGDFLPNLDTLRCNLAASDEPKHNVQEVFY